MVSSASRVMAQRLGHPTQSVTRSLGSTASHSPSGGQLRSVVLRILRRKGIAAGVEAEQAAASREARRRFPLRALGAEDVRLVQPVQVDAPSVRALSGPPVGPPHLRRSATSPSKGTSRSVGSSETRARAWVGLVSSRGVALRHTREGDEKDIWDRARVEDVVHFARSLDERLSRAVRAGLALAAN